ncbi:MAG: hydroxymethylbilane synthase [Ignavibacteriales bacterium]|nr:hydroxymethylbilane synthase [Ignavibacteriales bacterium]
MTNFSRHITVGTRGSELALKQTNIVIEQLCTVHSDLHIDIAIINTTGDYVLDVPLAKLGDRGVFTKELDAALLEKKIDFAVHSLKDVATVLPDGIIFGAICKREDAREVFISHPRKKYSAINQIPLNGVIATGSLRRTCMLLAHRPDLRIAEIRGNLNTRRRKLEESDWDGMMLARAGIIRLGWNSVVSEIVETEIVIPSPGQGALAVTIRKDDLELSELFRPFNDIQTEQTTTAERAVLRSMEGGCQVPVGAYGIIENNILKLDAMVGSLNGKRIVRKQLQGSPDSAEQVGVELAGQLLEDGGADILREIRA